MNTFAKLRSSAPVLLGIVMAVVGLAISGIAHPHAYARGKRTRPASSDRWSQSREMRSDWAPPRGHYPRRSMQPDPRVRDFLFPPHRPAPLPPRPMPFNETRNQAPLRSPFLLALDGDGDGFIDEREMARAAEALKSMDLNEDGRIGPTEWKARRGTLPIELNSRSPDRTRGKKAGRSSVGDDRPGRPTVEKSKRGKTSDPEAKK